VSRILGTENKEFDIIGLVDVVFLLVIFGLIIAVISLGGGTGPGGTGIIKTKMHIKVFRPDPLIQQSAMIIALDGKNADTIAFPTDQELLNIGNRELLELESGSYVADRLSEYAAAVDVTQDTILVEVDPETKFKIIGMILYQCSQNQIPIRAVRITTPEENEV